MTTGPRNTPGSPRSDKPRIAVIFGGRSSEHSISCLTAASVLAAVDRQRYDVVPIGITADGRWVLGKDATELTAGGLPEIKNNAAAVTLAPDPTVSSPALGVIDVAFPLLHGPYGEDGTVQGLLELAGIPYVGSGVFASAAAMDKHHMKRLLRADGLPVPDYVVVRDGQPVPVGVADLGMPLFVKPSRGGSSIGITKVTDRADLDAALVAAHAHDPKALVEAAVAGREIECGVLAGVGGQPPEASLPAEVRIAADADFYDFEAKYDEASGTEFDIPPQLPDDVIDRIRRTAIQAFHALDCEGLARVDFFLTDDDDLLVNEVNTMPGFTPASMYPQMWAATGVDYPELVARLVDDAIRRGTGLR